MYICIELDSVLNDLESIVSLLEVVQKCQCCQLCVLWENSRAQGQKKYSDC